MAKRTQVTLPAFVERSTLDGMDLREIEENYESLRSLLITYNAVVNDLITILDETIDTDMFHPMGVLSTGQFVVTRCRRGKAHALRELDTDD